MSDLVSLCESLARSAGEVLLAHYGSAELHASSKTVPTDAVTAADIAAERVLRERIAAERPDDGILGEEGTDVAGTSGLRWIVDPLDGTVNFLFGIPQWCVNVAVENGQGTLAAVTYDPVRDECFTADRASGVAALNGAPLRGSEKTELSDALVATGFAYDATVRARQAPTLAALIPRVRDVRRVGSAGLDLAWMAAGRFDAYYERSVKPWDIAPGVLLCTLAGLEIVELPAQDGYPGGILAAPAGLVPQLLAFGL